MKGLFLFLQILLAYFVNHPCTYPLNISPSSALSPANVCLFPGSGSQHFSINPYLGIKGSRLCSSRHVYSIYLHSFGSQGRLVGPQSFVQHPEKSWVQEGPGYGTFPRLNSSHTDIPNDQTSDAEENFISFSVSIAIHFHGRGHCSALR